MAATLTTEANAKLLAGSRFPTALTAGNWETYINMAEGKMSIDLGYDLITNYASINATSKYAIGLACAAYAAFLGAKYNAFSYFSLAEAQTVMSACMDIYDSIIGKLQGEKYKDFILS